MSSFVVRWLKISLVVVVGCGFLAMMIYALINREEISSSQIEPPLITPPSEPLKRRPDQPGGMQIPNRDKLVFDLLDSSNTTLGETGAGLPLEVSPLEVVVTVSESLPVTKPAAIVSAVSAPVQAPAQVSPVSVAPKTIEIAKVETKPAVVTVSPKEEAPVAKIEKPVETKVAGGKWGVQLAAVNTVADGNAMAAKAAKDFPALKMLTPRVSPVPGARKFRVQFVGLKDREAAAAVCAKLAGKQGCFPVSVQ